VHRQRTVLKTAKECGTHFLGMANKKNQEQRRLRHPSKTPPHVATDEGASEIMIVEFSVRILGPLCEENSEHHLDP